MKKYLRIRSWKKYQHYKDRNPAWIKLYTDIFQDYEFSCLQDASKLLAICTMTLAARYKDPKLGVVPCDINWIKNQCNLGNSVTVENLKELVDCGFLEDDSNALAECYQSASPEKETETEVDKKRDTKVSLKKVSDFSDDFEEFWILFPRQRRGDKQRALEKWNYCLRKGYTVEQMMQGVKSYQDSREVAEGYAKNAASWLYNAKFLDNYQPPKQSQGDEWQRAMEKIERGEL